MARSAATLAEGIAVKSPGAAHARDHCGPCRPHRPGARTGHRARRGDAGEYRKTMSRGRRRCGPCRDPCQPERFRGRKVGTILCGGNIDTHLLANVLVRELVRCDGLRGCASPPRAGLARSPRSPPNSTNAASTSSRPITTASSPACRQGHGDRSGMRSARRAGDRYAGQAARRGRLRRRTQNSAQNLL